MSGRTIAIGDIHGCRKEFEALLSAIAPNADDELVLLGDYIDRGPESWGVIERILKLQNECKVISILGNHELMLLDASYDQDALRPWLGFGGDATLESYRRGPKGLPPLTIADLPYRRWLWELDASREQLRKFPASHREFLCACSSYYESPTHLFVHANCRSEVDPKDELPHYLHWDVVDPRVSRPHKSGKVMVVGHAAQKSGNILNLGHRLYIDTFCHGGGWLTGLDVANRHYWQANRDGDVVEKTLR